MLREVISNEWFTILIVLSLCILAFAKYAFSNRFNDYLWVVGNSKYLKVYAREQKFIDHFDSLLFVNLTGLLNTDMPEIIVLGFTLFTVNSSGLNQFIPSNPPK